MQPRWPPPTRGITSTPIAMLLLLLASTITPASAAIKNDFSSYPSGSQSCLDTAANKSKCTGDTGAEMNRCLCTNGGNFVYNTAQCVAKQSSGDLKTVYAMLKSNCAGTGVTIAVSEDAFMAQAAAAATSTIASTKTSASATATGTSTSASASTTSSGTASPTSTSGTDTTQAPLSTTSKIGIGAGIGLGSVALILAGVFIWVYNRRRNSRAGRRGGGGASAAAGPYAQTRDDSPSGTYAGTFGGSTAYGGSGHWPSPQPGAAIPLSAVSGGGGWKSPGDGTYYKSADEVHHGQAGQPLLAELGGGGGQQVAPVEIYTPQYDERTGPAAAATTNTGGLHPQPSRFGPQGYHAELPAQGHEGWQSPPGSHSPYSPPYERSHF